MVSSLTSRPVSSVRNQQDSSRLPSTTNTTTHLNPKSVTTEPSPRIGSVLSTSSDCSAVLSLSDDRHSSPFAASARSSEYSFDRSSLSTAATFPPPPREPEQLPSIAALDSLGTKQRRLVEPSSVYPDRHTFVHPTTAASAMNPSDKSDHIARRGSPPPQALRRPTSPAGRISNHSAEWDMHSDRGSPRMPSRRLGLPPPPAPSAAPPSAYAREYINSPRTSYRESAYREPHPATHRELSPPSTTGLKRKLSNTSDMGARRPFPERVDRNGNAWGPSDYPPLPATSRAAAAGAYAEPGYYRGRERGDTPERAYSGSYSRDPAYSARHADSRMEDPHYSPRHAHPASPSTSRTAYHRGGYDAVTPSGHPYPVAARRSDRYSPGPSPRSPSYVSRQVVPPHRTPSPHDGYGRSAPQHLSYSRRPSPPPFASDPRPQLPPLSSRTPASRYPASAAAAAPPPPPPPPPRGGRYTPPLEASLASDRLSPEIDPHAYSEPFYPDRRLYFARERIQDHEMDEYYNGPIGANGSSGASKGRYADYPYDPYGSPHAGSYPSSGAHKGANGPMLVPSPVSAPLAPHPGAAGGRHLDSRVPYTSPYAPGDYMSHDPRDMHPSMVRPGGPMGRPVMAMPATHVPPGPSAGIAPPPRRRGKLPKPVTDLLKSWLLEHASHPYPTEDEKRSLCSMTGLTLSQVSNWFINARRRILLPTGANGSPGGSTAAQVKAAFSGDSPSPPHHEA
ncbi:uncharacterized protein UDID_00760 [Ustilago sp. UG-2017a]|nr:uncharacterized protein UDID_00760 [Ustilago sp. UG-2017a]